MSSASWENYLQQMVKVFRTEFRSRFKPEFQDRIRQEALHDSLLEPCQIEVLDFGENGSVLFLIVHDDNLADMTFKIHENAQSVDESEFIDKYGYGPFNLAGKSSEKFLEGKSLVICTKDSLRVSTRGTPPQDIVKWLLSDLSRVIMAEQVDVIKRSTAGLKERIAKISGKEDRDELFAPTKTIDEALKEIERLSQEIGKMRQLMGASQEYQDWKLLVSDVDKLKVEHVSREVLDLHIKRLDEKIGKGLESLNTRMEDLKAIKFWSKRTILEIALAIWGAIITLYATGVIKF